MSVFEYLPQRPPALLVTEVLAADPEGSRCLARIPADSPFVEQGRAPAYLALEMGAQAAAAGEARQRAAESGGGEAQGGYVVRITRAVFHVTSLDATGEFELHTSLRQAAPPLRTWSCHILQGGELLVEGEVSTFAG